MKEREILNLFYSLCADNIDNDVSYLILQCCNWNEPGAITKLKYWLAFGIKHDGAFPREIFHKVIQPTTLKKVFLEVEAFIENFADEIELTKF